MVTGFQLTSMFLVCLLSEFSFSSAFPTGRSSVEPQERWRFREQLKDRYNSGHRRPLQFIQAVRHNQRKLLPNVHNPARVTTQRMLQGNTWSHGRTQNQPGLYHHTESLDPTTIPQSPPQQDHAVAKPRSFEFNLKLPFVSVGVGQNKGTSSNVKGSDSSSGESIRPTSVEINSSFRSPSAAHPKFHFSLAVPIPVTTQSPKMSSSDEYFQNVPRPGTAGFVQHSNTGPAEPQPGSSQSGSELSSWLNSGRNVQQQTLEPVKTKPDSKPVTGFPGHVGQAVARVEQITKDEVPSKQSVSIPQPDSTTYLTPFLPVPYYSRPHPYDSRYHSANQSPTSNNDVKGQSGPTVSQNPTDVHVFPSLPSSGQVSGINYGQLQPWQLYSTQVTSSEQRAYSQPQTSTDHRQNEETVPNVSPVFHPSAPSPASSQHGLLLFAFSRKEEAPTSVPGNMGQMAFVPFSGQYSRGQGQDAFSDHVYNVYQSTDQQNQHPGQDSSRGQYGKPSYRKVLIDMEDEAERGTEVQTAPTAPYDGYAGLNYPYSLPAKPRSMPSVSQDQHFGRPTSPFESYPNYKPDYYMPSPNLGY